LEADELIGREDAEVITNQHQQREDQPELPVAHHFSETNPARFQQQPAY